MFVITLCQSDFAFHSIAEAAHLSALLVHNYVGEQH